MIMAIKLFYRSLKKVLVTVVIIVYIYNMSTSNYVLGMEMRIRNVPDDWRREFKILCAKEDKSMNRKLLELLKEAIDKAKEVSQN